MANEVIENINTGSAPSSGSSEVPFSNDLKKLKDIIEKNLKDTEDRINKKIENSEKQADERQIKSVEVLGIFMAFLSFIAVNVQIFSRVSSTWSAGLFILLFFCALAILVVLIDLILTGVDIKSKNIKGYYKELAKDYRIILIILFLIIGCTSVISLRGFTLNPIQGTLEFEDSFNKRIDDKVDTLLQNKFYSKDQVDTIISSSTVQTNTEINDFKRCLNDGSWSKCFK